MQKSELSPAIYISYAWGSESEAIAESIEREFQKRGVDIIRDKNALKYKGQIKAFMEQIGQGKYVILVISNKYLRSENCMFELLQIFKNQNFYERIFPVVLDEVKIAKATDRLDLLKYWENESENLDRKIRELNELANIQGVAEDLNLYTEIRNNIARLTNILKDINTLNTDRHINSDFEQLCNLVQTQMKADFGGKGIKEIMKWSATAVLGVVVVFLTFQGVKKSGLFDNDTDKKDSIGVVGLDTVKILETDSVKRLDDLEKKVIVKEDGVSYEVTLVVPSNMVNSAVFVDQKPAEIIERNLVFIKVRLKKKEGSHHFEIKDGDESCSTDAKISTENMRLTLCD